MSADIAGNAYGFYYGCLNCPAATNLTVALPSTAAGRKPGVNLPLLASAFRSVSVASAAFSEPLVRLLTLSTSRTLPAVTPSAPKHLTDHRLHCAIPIIMANMRRRRCSLIFVLNWARLLRDCRHRWHCGGQAVAARLVVPALVSLLLPAQIHVAPTHPARNIASAVIKA